MSGGLSGWSGLSRSKKECWISDQREGSTWRWLNSAGSHDLTSEIKERRDARGQWSKWLSSSWGCSHEGQVGLW
jgi:hypothetical protein